jgi:hypothetical protein
MHKLIGAACRRTAGIAAGIVLTGGLAGVVLTPGTAFAGTTTPPPPPSPLSTTTTINATQTPVFGGATLNAQVSVSAGTGNPSPTGTVNVSGAGGGCTATLAPGSGGTSTGNCNIYHVLYGTYTLTASYVPSSTAFGASSGQTTVTVGQAPVFDMASPPLTATPGQAYSYTFHARGFPWHITYSLTTNASWLSINPYTGTVSGTVPFGASSFSYSVTATNSAGSTTVGPFWVNVRYHRVYINIDTNLSCTSPVFTGQRGSCTLWVTNRGFSPASNVTAQIALPSQLRADYCGYFWSFGCTISNNTAYQNLGTLYRGQTKALTVVFTARTGWNLWGRHPGHRFTVKVVGSAASYGYWWFFGQRQSYSVAYVTIIPRGFWW